MIRAASLPKSWHIRAMNAQIKLGRIFGVEIGLHYSWFIIALLITLSLASQFSLSRKRAAITSDPH